MPRALNVVGALAALIAAGAVQVHAQSGRYPAARHGGNYMHNFYFPPAPSSTPWAPSWAPDGESVAVAMSGSIWRVDVETGAAKELTYAPDAYHTSPDWSPDGQWIVYAADYDGDRVQLELLEVASGETRALTGDDHVYADPTFSPDGARIAYVSTRPNGYFNIGVRPVEDGRWAGDEMPVTVDRVCPANRLYFGPFDMHLTPAWVPAAPGSTESDELLLVSNRDIPLGSGNVLRVPVAPGGIVDAVTVLREQMFRKAKAQGATVGYVHAFTGEGDPLHRLLGGAKGFMVDAALGTTDALEWSDANRAGFFPLYAVWNNGLRVTATGARTPSATCNARSSWGRCGPTSIPAPVASTSTPGSKVCGRGGRSSRRARWSS